GKVTIALRGRSAQALAGAFEREVGSKRTERLRSVVLGWLPWADVNDVSLTSAEGSWEIAVEAAIEIHGYGRPEGKDGKTWTLPGLEPVHVVVPRGAAGTLAARYASRGARQSALSIDAPLNYEFLRRIQLPEGASIARAPADVKTKGPSLV